MISGMPLSWRDIFLFPISAGRIFSTHFPVGCWLRAAIFWSPAASLGAKRSPGSDWVSLELSNGIYCFSQDQWLQNSGCQAVLGHVHPGSESPVLRPLLPPRIVGISLPFYLEHQKDFEEGSGESLGGFLPHFCEEQTSVVWGLWKQNQLELGLRSILSQSPIFHLNLGFPNQNPGKTLWKNQPELQPPPHIPGGCWEEFSSEFTSESNCDKEKKPHLAPTSPPKRSNPTLRGAGRETGKGRQDLAWCLCCQNAPSWNKTPSPGISWPSAGLETLKKFQYPILILCISQWRRFEDTSWWLLWWCPQKGHHFCPRWIQFLGFLFGMWGKLGSATRLRFKRGLPAFGFWTLNIQKESGLGRWSVTQRRNSVPAGQFFQQ